MKRIARVGLAVPALLLAGCVILPPSGPSLQALPGSRSSFPQFQQDDAACRAYAFQQVGGKGATEAAQESAAASAVAGTLLGAAVGAALGGGHEGAAVGAGFGLLTGALAGTGTAQASYYGVQRSYDGAYYSCMYARGHRVPVSASYTESGRPPATVAMPPPNAGVPPPNAPPPTPQAAPYAPPYWPSVPPPATPSPG